MIRIGNSIDVHALKPGKSLRLGGIDVPSIVESVGHSDADCLIHSIAEALLGSLALGDLGTHFPDDDAQYKNIDSMILLDKVYQMVTEKGYGLHNLDAMIILEKPILKPYIFTMRERISNALNVSIDTISIKATTSEKIGAVGEQRAIICHSVITVKPRSTAQFL